MSEKRLAFDSGKLKLVGVLSTPERGRGPFPGVVVCHPHPKYGGDMNNNVVLAAVTGLTGQGIAVLRFNFRGMGGSEGSYTGGPGEQEDVLAAIAFLEAQKEIDRTRTGLAGYSFGAGIAADVAPKSSTVRALALIAPPTPNLGTPEFRGYAAPKLILAGDMDTFMPIDIIRSHTAKMAGLVELSVLLEADHFMGGYEGDIATRVGEFFKKWL